MATPLPIVRGPSTALYPFTQTYIAQTGISDAQNGSTARWVKGYPLVQFELGYNPIGQAAKNVLKGALASAKGQFATDLSVTTDQAYTNLSFDSDEFAAAEQKSTRYGVRWALTQTVPQNLAPGAPSNGYPLAGNGTICQLPYTQKRRYQTIASKVDAGPKYNYAEFGNGLANFPSAGLMGWEFDEKSLTDAEVAAKVAHFLANWGDCFPFTFLDEPDATSASSVTLGTGSRTFATQAGLGYTAGLGARFVSRSSGAILDATVTSYAGTSLVVSVAVVAGSGTFADWTISPRYPNVRYASPQLAIKRLGLNQSSIRTALIQSFS